MLIAKWKITGYVMVALREKCHHSIGSITLGNLAEQNVLKQTLTVAQNVEVECASLKDRTLNTAFNSHTLARKRFHIETNFSFP